MSTFIICVILAFVVLMAVSLHKVYHHVTVKELRRRARTGDPVAQALYRVASYGVGLDIFLWLLTGLASGLLLWKLSVTLDAWLAVPLVLVLVLTAFAWLPSRQVNRLSWRAATVLASPISLFLSFIQPLSSRLSVVISSLRPINFHAGIYEKDDLLELLDRQKSEVDNRISDEELTIARGALTFSDKPIREFMTPRRVIKMVASDESVSPHLMDQLHKSGFSRFPVFETDDNSMEKIVGTLYLRDLLNHSSGGLVKSIMKKDVYYVHEERSLMHALNAFLRTQHHLFIVTNSFEEIVGVISIEDVIEQIIGHPIIDEFDKYDDLRAVAALHAEADRKSSLGKYPIQ